MKINISKPFHDPTTRFGTVEKHGLAARSRTRFSLSDWLFAFNDVFAG